MQMLIADELFRSSEDKGKLSFCKPVHDFGIDGLID
jgi:hypothetical protein